MTGLRAHSLWEGRRGSPVSIVSGFVVGSQAWNMTSTMRQELMELARVSPHPGRSGAFRAPLVMIPGLTSSGSRRSVAKRFGARSRRRLLIHCASFSGLGTFGLPIKPSTHYFRAYILPCNEIVALMFQAELTGMESPRRLGVVSPTKPCQGLRVSARTPETLRCVWRKPARCQRNATLSLS